MEERLLDIPAVARILNVSVQRTYELIRLGLVPSVRLGRQVRVDRERLSEFINNGGKGLPGGWRREE